LKKWLYASLTKSFLERWLLVHRSSCWVCSTGLRKAAIIVPSSGSIIAVSTGKPIRSCFFPSVSFNLVVNTSLLVARQYPGFEAKLSRFQICQRDKKYATAEIWCHFIVRHSSTNHPFVCYSLGLSTLSQLYLLKVLPIETINHYPNPEMSFLTKTVFFSFSMSKGCGEN
jgi:hypothetical protein